MNSARIVAKPTVVVVGIEVHALVATTKVTAGGTWITFPASAQQQNKDHDRNDKVLHGFPDM